MATQAIEASVSTPGWLRGWRAEWTENKLAYWLLIPSILGFILFLIYPIASMFTSAFSTVDTMGRITQLGTLENFTDLAGDEQLPMIIRQTVTFAFGTVLLEVILAFPLALILNSYFPGRAWPKR